MNESKRMMELLEAKGVTHEAWLGMTILGSRKFTQSLSDEEKAIEDDYIAWWIVNMPNE